MPAMQRASGTVRIGLERRDGSTRLARLFQEGSAKARFPKQSERDHEAVLINTAGGLTGGDRFLTEIDAGPGTRATITTQAAEKVYRSAQGRADIANRIRVGAKAHVSWLPQETILFNRSALTRRLEIDLDETASLLALEAVIFGRQAMGERVNSASFRESWRIRRSGRLIHAEDTALEGAVDDLLQRQAVLGGGSAIASLVYVAADAEDHVRRCREAIGDCGGASAWDGRLAIRLAASDGLALRRVLHPLIVLLAGPQAVPRLWLM